MSVYVSAESPVLLPQDVLNPQTGISEGISKIFRGHSQTSYRRRSALLRQELVDGDLVEGVAGAQDG